MTIEEDGRSVTDPSTEASPREDGLYFFPEDHVTATQLREILDSGSHDRRCWAISHLLRFAQWDDIWVYVTRDQVRDVFSEIELPENLSTAWGRMLKVEAPVA